LGEGDRKLDVMDTMNADVRNKHRNIYNYLEKTPAQRLSERRERICRGRKLLRSEDPRSSILTHFEEYGYFLVGDKLINRNEELDSRIGWIYVNFSRNKKCVLWHHAIYDNFGYIPSPCYECFKVVVNPRTVKELFVLYERSKDLKINSKCGIEKRPFVFGPYSMFFYAHGLREGLRHYQEVRDTVNKSFSTGVPVVLKRGCTLYELEMGPSDQWKVTPSQMEFESFLKENISEEIMNWEIEAYSQPEELMDVVKRTWLEWAYHIGDVTYLEFTGGRSLFPKGATYHDNVETI
jgi:hypothetical protein